MGMALYDDLVQAVQEKRALFVIGAGVSLGATETRDPRNSTAGWEGLIKDGLRWAKEVGHRRDRWLERELEGLTDAFTDGLVEDMLRSATTVEQVLGRPDGEWYRWLKTTFERLEATDPQALRALGILSQNRGLATTNYDGLITQVTGLAPITWKDDHKAPQFLREGLPVVLHLHGYWNVPASVVLGYDSYADVVGDVPAQAIQQALAATRCLVFVGFGAGLADPNFGPLFRWMGRALKASPYRHYRLVLNEEVDKVRNDHPQDQRVMPLAYDIHPNTDGYDRYAALGPFLEGLAQDAGLNRAKTAASPPPKPRPRAPATEPAHLEAYLGHIHSVCGGIDLTGLLLMEKGAPVLSLDDVYVSLSAARRGGPDEFDANEPHRGSERRENVVSKLVKALEKSADSDTLRPLITAAFGRRLHGEDADRILAETEARLRALKEDLSPKAVERVLATQPLEESIRQCQHLLIEGDPGSGKTTTLKRIAVALAHAWQGDTQVAEDMGFRKPYPLPLFAPLRDFARQADLTAPGTDGRALVAYLEQVHGDWVGPRLQEGTAVVLLDGLDEVMDDAERARVADVLRDFLVRHPTCRFVVTSRPGGLTAEVRRQLEQLGKLKRTQVEPLSVPQIRRFVRAWYRAIQKNPAESKLRADDLVNRIRTNPRIERLVSTPILLTAVAVVHLNQGRLPERRAELYEQCIQALAGRWDAARRIDIQMEHDRRIQLFAELAYERHQHGQDEPQRISRRDLLAATKKQLKQQSGSDPSEQDVRESAAVLVERSGLLVQDKEAFYRFRHLTFQEFLAARWIATRTRRPAKDMAKYLHHSGWREAVLLFLGFEARDGPSRPVQHLDILAEEASHLPTLEDRARAFATLAQGMLDLRQYPGAEDLDVPAKDLLPHFAEMVEHVDQPAALKDRVILGEALGAFGDSRLKEDRRWIEIPQGRFLRGAAPDDPEANSYESPAGWVDHGTYRMQRWPVTVEEFAGLIEAGGYEDERWWSEHGWAWRKEDKVHEPEGWSEQSPYPNRPVVGVSFWEAEAYCRWLDAQDVTGGWRVHLPTEAQWERAARGTDKRRYPWGDDWDEARALSDRTKEIRHAVPVGLFPQGHGPEGIWDAAGNVEEWCDGLRRSYSDPEWLSAKNAGPNAPRVCRGGSWAHPPHWLRVSSRPAGHPASRPRLLGFRCACSPPRTLDP